jgi:hypothetical protein
MIIRQNLIIGRYIAPFFSKKAFSGRCATVLHDVYLTVAQRPEKAL